MNTQTAVLTNCDKEPIHIPGSIQPHGLLIVADKDTHRVTYVAGDIENRLGLTDWLDKSLEDIFGPEICSEILSPHGVVPRGFKPQNGHETFDISVAHSATELMVELEPAAQPEHLTTLLPLLETAANAFDRAEDFSELFGLAARDFRRLTGFDRVMVYQFLEDSAGKVVAESSVAGLPSFLNHHFPASDIPVQARALYVRNLVRVIPDVFYTSAPMRPDRPADQPLDMTDCILRSIAPVHLQYLKNMGVAASASFSIVKDGTLWGLVTCHNFSPRNLSLDVRNSCRALAGALGRQIKAREEAATFKEHVRLREIEDKIVRKLTESSRLPEGLAASASELTELFDADGIVIAHDGNYETIGHAPPENVVTALKDWLATRPDLAIFASSHLAAETHAAISHPLGAGVMAMTINADLPVTIFCFRAEILETVNWAGNPHKTEQEKRSGILTPRESFASWSEDVRGKARKWTHAEHATAQRLVDRIQRLWQARHIQDLNIALGRTLAEKEVLLQQKEFLLGEVNHRVKNSLALVSAFLSMQARSSADDNTRHSLEEARHRVASVALVHGRLYGTNEFRNIDAGRYIEELLADVLSATDESWKSYLTCEIDSLWIGNNEAVSLGLIVTELIINANKYAYDGQPGPLHVRLTQEDDHVVMSVADKGKGLVTSKAGFGSQMIGALLQQLDGTIEYRDNRPGTCAVVKLHLGILRDDTRD